MCAFETGRVLWDDRSGVACALSVLLIYPMFYYARNSNVDVPVLFFTAAGLVAFAHIVRDGLSLRRALIFGALVGLAVATKEPAFASFAFAPVVMLFLPNPGVVSVPWRSGVFWKMALAGAVCALVAYALAGGMLVDFSRWSAHINFIRSRLQDLEANAVIFVTYYPRTLDGHLAFLQRLTRYLADCLSWPGLVLGAGSMVAVAWRRQRDSMLILSAMGYLVVLFFSARTAQLRYLLPAAYVLALYGGRGAVKAWDARGSMWRVPAIGLAAASTVILVSWATDLTSVMLRDSRYAAGAWLARTARPGDALEYFGSEHKNPPMPAELASQRAIPFLGSMYRADTSQRAVEEIRQAWRERRPRFIAILPDYTNPGQPFSISCPPAIFRALEDGSLGYRRAALFQTPPLLTWLPRPALDHPVVNPPIRLYQRLATAKLGA